MTMKLAFAGEDLPDLLRQLEATMHALGGTIAPPAIPHEVTHEPELENPVAQPKAEEPAPVKRPRGRPRKNPLPETKDAPADETPVPEAAPAAPEGSPADAAPAAADPAAALSETGAGEDGAESTPEVEDAPQEEPYPGGFVDDGNPSYQRDKNGRVVLDVNNEPQKKIGSVPIPREGAYDAALEELMIYWQYGDVARKLIRELLKTYRVERFVDVPRDKGDQLYHDTIMLGRKLGKVLEA